jgi:hypothetical protein
VTRPAEPAPSFGAAAGPRRGKGRCPVAHATNGKTAGPAHTTPPAACAGGGAPINSDLDGAPPGGRARDGKFSTGNRLSKGNSAHRKMAELRRALFAGLDEGRMRTLGEKLFAMAAAGDLEAMKVLLAYSIGKPQRMPDEDALDLMEWRLLRAAPSLQQVWYVIDQLADPAIAAQLFRDRSAATAAELFQQICRVTDADPLRFARSQVREAEAKIGK